MGKLEFNNENARWLPRVYLAGAIRDNHVEEDYIWRENIIETCRGLAVFLNPLAGKTFNIKTRIWDYCGVPPVADLIVKHDFWCVAKADIIIFNFKALTQDYPMIGSLVEFGQGTQPDKLLWSIIEPGYVGHGNTGMFKLHPFLEKNSAVIFKSVDEALEKIPWMLATTSGADPHFAGIVND